MVINVPSGRLSKGLTHLLPAEPGSWEGFLKPPNIFTVFFLLYGITSQKWLPSFLHPSLSSKSHFLIHQMPILKDGKAESIPDNDRSQAGPITN